MVMVAICDDEIAIGAELEWALIDIFTSLNVKHQIDVFFTSDELCREMQTGFLYDLIFLDIEFAKNEINGVEVGRLIRDAYKNYTASIVYISWEKKYAMQLFEIRPMNFLIKPMEYEKIMQTVRTYLMIAGLLFEEFTYKKGHDTFKVQIKDIVYLENRKRKIIIYFADGRKEEFYESLKNVYNEQLKRFDFLFIHASYVVNYDYITVVNYNHLFIIDSITPLPISPNRRNEVREKYLAIIKKRRVG